MNIYLKHNSTNEPFTVSFIGDMQQTACNAVAQFEIKLDHSSDITIDGYPTLLNSTANQNNYEYCSGLCNNNDLCRAWMYNVTGYCWLLTTSDLNIYRKGGYVSGICDSENIFDANSSCLSGETLIQEGYKSDPTNYFREYHII